MRCYSHEQLSFQSASEARRSDEQLKADDGEFLNRYGRFCVGSLQSAALRARDVLLPISIVFRGACYAFRECTVPHLVGNEFQWDQMASYIPARHVFDPPIALRHE
jgi:hypothetical protein